VRFGFALGVGVLPPKGARKQFEVKYGASGGQPQWVDRWGRERQRDAR
jgi:hypothetical protein